MAKDWKKNPRNWSDDKVSPSQLDEFRERVQAMADKVFGTDDEGDSTVEVYLTDRTRGRRPHFVQMPYENDLENAIFNLRVAFSDFDTAQRIVDYHLAAEIHKKNSAAAESQEG